MPAIIKTAAAYSFSISINSGAETGQKIIPVSMRFIDFRLSAGHRQWFAKSSHVYNSKNYPSLIRFGADAMIFKTISVKTGYYHELKDIKAGFYWAAGLFLNANRWINAGIPADLRFDITTRNNPDLLERSITQKNPGNFRDRTLFFNLSLILSIRK
jgi:hypothetical protein